MAILDRVRLGLYYTSAWAYLTALSLAALVMLLASYPFLLAGILLWGKDVEDLQR